MYILSTHKLYQDCKTAKELEIPRHKYIKTAISLTPEFIYKFEYLCECAGLRRFVQISELRRGKLEFVISGISW